MQSSWQGFSNCLAESRADGLLLSQTVALTMAHEVGNLSQNANAIPVKQIVHSQRGLLCAKLLSQPIAKAKEAIPIRSSLLSWQ